MAYNNNKNANIIAIVITSIIIYVSNKKLTRRRFVGASSEFFFDGHTVECTGSLRNSEVKRHRARLVLGWGTAREAPGVLSAFVSKLLQLHRNTQIMSEFRRRFLSFSFCGCFYNQKKKSGANNHKKDPQMGAKLTAPPGLPGRSPTPVLTGPCAA